MGGQVDRRRAHNECNHITAALNLITPTTTRTVRSEKIANARRTAATRLTKILFDIDCDADAIIMKLRGSQCVVLSILTER